MRSMLERLCSSNVASASEGCEIVGMKIKGDGGCHKTIPGRFTRRPFWSGAEEESRDQQFRSAEVPPFPCQMISIMMHAT